MSAIARWEGFLEKVAGRQLELLVEAAEGLQGLIEADPVDIAAVDRALHALRFRIDGLREKIGDAWSDAIDLLRAEGGEALVDRALDRREDVEAELRERWDRFRLEWTCHAYRWLWPRVGPALREPVACVQCGAALRVRRDRSANATCGACGAVNQVGAHRVVSVYRGGAAVFAEAAALAARHAVERHRLAADRKRRHAGWAPEPIASLEEWERLERAYWERYADALVQFGGATRRSARELVEARMRGFVEQVMCMDPRWRAARGL